MGHEERERSATAVGLGLVGAFFALRSLDNEYAGMVLQVWDEQVDGDNVSMSPPDATRPPGPRPEGGQAYTRGTGDIFREGQRIRIAPWEGQHPSARQH